MISEYHKNATSSGFLESITIFCGDHFGTCKDMVCFYCRGIFNLNDLDEELRGGECFLFAFDWF